MISSRRNCCESLSSSDSNENDDLFVSRCRKIIPIVYSFDSDNAELNYGNETEWREDIAPIREFDFNEMQCKVKLYINLKSSSRYIFNKIFPSGKIIDATNKYGKNL